MIPPANDIILELKDVSFNYPDGSPGLVDCSLSLLRGSRTVLLGPNGAGKTTLFLHCNGILLPASGKVLFNGKPLDYGRQGLHDIRSRIGLVFQNPDNQLFSASVLEDVSFGPINLGLDSQAVRERAKDALSAVGMDDYADKPVHNLSYGQKKRVCIAGVLAMRPQVMILDEPTAGLDVEMRHKLMDILQRLHGEGMTVIMATHDVDLAYSWADDVCILDHGRSVMECPAGELPDKALVLERYGLGVPHVARIYRLLATRGMFPPEERTPRSCAELARLLKEYSD